MSRHERARLSQPLLKRAAALRERGVSYRDIAIVLSMDTGQEYTTEATRYALRHLMGAPPKRHGSIAGLRGGRPHGT